MHPSQGESTPLIAKKQLIHQLSPEDVGPLKRKFLVACLFLGAFLSSLDLTIVATTIPRISSDLHLSQHGSWIGVSYLWSTTTWTPLYGRLSDIIGRRDAYLQAVFLFGIGTLFCGVSSNLPVLAASRFLAGMGGGGISTVGSVVLADLFNSRDRAMYQSIFFIGFAAGMGCGGPIGGFVTKHWGWQAVFLVQVPFIALGYVMAFVCIPRTKKSGPVPWRTMASRVDLAGSLALLLSIGSLLFALSLNANSDVHFPDPRLVSTVAASFLFFLSFIFIELKIAAEPVLPIELLKNRTACLVGIIAGFVAIVNFSMTYLVPTLYEICFQQGMAEAGLHMLPNAVAMIIGAPLAGIMARITGRYKTVTVVSCLGPLVSMLWLAFIDKEAKVAQWLCILPMGLGFSSLLTATLLALLSDVEQSQIATATGFIYVWRSLGQVSGVALSQAIFQSVLSTELSERIDDPNLVEKLRRSMESIKDLPEAVQVVARQAYRVSTRDAFLFSAACAGITLTAALFLRDTVLETREGDDKLLPEGAVDF
ncbi:MFS general substrate transporter [Meredithblackwellia eburnea MCA 4105]